MELQFSIMASIVLRIIICALLVLSAPVACLVSERQAYVAQGVRSAYWVKLSSPLVRQVIQRDAENKGTIIIEGIAGHKVKVLQARAISMTNPQSATDWELIAHRDYYSLGVKKNIINWRGEFAGQIQIPAGGWYEIQVRPRDSLEISEWAFQPRVGVGEVFITAGQSNSGSWGRPPQMVASDKVSVLTNGTWQIANDPQPNFDTPAFESPRGGSPWPILGDLLVRDLKVPVGFLGCAFGGSNSDSWSPGGLHYECLRRALKIVGPNGARAVLWHQGETDAGVTDLADGKRYFSTLKDIISASRIDAAWTIPWGIALATYLPEGSEENSNQIRTAQERLGKEPNCFAGPDTDRFTGNKYRYDRVHFNENGLRAHAMGWREKIMGHFFL